MSQSTGDVIQDLFSDRVAGIKVFSHCMCLVDAMNDNNHRLVCAETRNRLKVFKGNSLQSEAALQFPPSVICSYYAMDSVTKNITPYFAIGGGIYLYIYKNIKGTVKFPMPNTEPVEEEAKIYKEYYDAEIDIKTCLAHLKELSDSDKELSYRTIELLKIKDEDSQLDFLSNYKGSTITISNYITCLNTIKTLNGNQENTPSNILVGSEGCFVFVIDPFEKKIIAKIKLPEAAFMINSTGNYDSEHKIYVADRYFSIYIIGRNKSITSTINLSHPIITMVISDRGIYLATTAKTYKGLSITGKENFSIAQPVPINALEVIQQNSSQYIIIALKNSEIRLYKEKNIIHVLGMKENIFAMKFGRYGGMDNCIIFISQSGGLFIKTINPNKSLDSLKYNPEESKEDAQLNIPKKTPMYVDLVEREKESAADMQNTFQSDLMRLRYKAMDTYVNMLKIGNAPQNYSSSSPMKISAILQGLGPDFKLNLIIGNVGTEPIASTELTLDYNRNVYAFDKDNIQLGLIMPNIPVKYSLTFKNTSETGCSGMVKIIIIDKNKNTPLIQSIVKVPISELEIL